MLHHDECTRTHTQALTVVYPETRYANLCIVVTSVGRCLAEYRSTNDPLPSSPGPTGSATLLVFPGGLVQCDSPGRGQAH